MNVREVALIVDYVVCEPLVPVAAKSMHHWHEGHSVAGADSIRVGLPVVPPTIVA